MFREKSILLYITNMPLVFIIDVLEFHLSDLFSIPIDLENKERVRG